MGWWARKKALAAAGHQFGDGMFDGFVRLDTRADAADQRVAGALMGIESVKRRLDILERQQEAIWMSIRGLQAPHSKPSKRGSKRLKRKGRR